MSIKVFLRKEIATQLTKLREQVANNEEAEQALVDLNPRKANYQVLLCSSWSSEGEESTTTDHTGTLAEAISRAEQEFKKVNHRSDVQGSYDVYVRVGKVKYKLPEALWEEHREKR